MRPKNNKKKLNLFSSRFKTYLSWRRGRKLTPYAKRIITLHKQTPKLTLSQLLRIRKPKDLSKKAWSRLTPKQKSERILALKVLSQMRERKSLSRASEEFGISPETAQSHIRSAIKKKRNRWVAKKHDRIQRQMVINEKGESKSIIVINSKDASLIGKYHNAVKQFLQTGDESLLKPFKNESIKDSRGRKHLLETNPQALFDIAEAREDAEFFEIYESD